jgi:hypothetical protein
MIEDDDPGDKILYFRKDIININVKIYKSCVTSVFQNWRTKNKPIRNLLIILSI